MKSIGVLGGSFDPIHHGHLRLAIETLEALALDQVLLIPLNRPNADKRPCASGDQRLAMLQAALTADSRLRADDRELKRGGMSYTVDTLLSVRGDHPADSLCLILGLDAYHSIGRWHRWQSILDLANVIVAERPGFEKVGTAQVPDVFTKAEVVDPRQMKERPHGGVYRQRITLLDISSSDIRRRIQQGYSARYLLPDVVHDYILTNALYSGAET